MILITGATGFIGHYLLARLLRAGYACAVLVRPPQSESMGRLAGLLAGVGLDAAEFIRAERLVPLEGDLDDCWPLTRDATVSPLDASRPSRVKGWPSARELRVATIVHSAASTRFASGSDGEPERTNVRGTRRLLDWADAAGVRRFHLVSSAYVCGRSAGPVAERFEFDPAAFHNDYERAKWRAEQLCVEWAGQGRADDCQSQNPENGPAGRRSHTEGSRSHTGFGRGSRSLTIHRPSVVVGEFGSGRSVKFAGFYLMARATELLDRAFASACDADRQAVPLRIGARPADRQNIVPVDYVADCMAAIVGDPGRDGRVYHITHPDPPSNQLIKRAMETYFRIAGGRFVEPARLGGAELNTHEQAFYDVSRSIGHYFVDTPIFQRHNMRAVEQATGLHCPSYDQAAIHRLIAFAQAANWGRGRSSSRGGFSPCAAYFERFLPRFVGESQVARMTGLTTTLRFVIEDEPDGQWVCQFERGRLRAVHRGPDGVVEEFGYRSTRDVFWEAITGRVPPQELFLSGRAELFGDIERAMKMATILHEFTREFPCDPRRLAEVEQV